MALKRCKKLSISQKLITYQITNMKHVFVYKIKTFNHNCLFLLISSIYTLLESYQHTFTSYCKLFIEIFGLFHRESQSRGHCFSVMAIKDFETNFFFLFFPCFCGAFS